MRIHEFQAKEILAAHGIPVPPGHVASTPEEARQAAETLGGPVVVKAQIYAGGRGKAGGVKAATSPEGAEKIAGDLLGNPLVTHQTGPNGRVVRRVLIEKATPVKKEIYLGIAVDRSRRAVAVIASPAGGVDIEETASQDPSLISKEWVEPAVGLRPFQAFRLALKMGNDLPTTRKIAGIIVSFYTVFLDCDCLLAEINPLAISADGEVLAIDAKLNLDDNALYRHPEIGELRDPSEEDPLEVEATSYNLNYIKLDGNVGCLVNGAGLAMATMDLIKLAGASPANFLDVGGGATEEMIEKGFHILVDDPDVRAVFINIFGGILRCDILAHGIVAAAKKARIRIPVVVRLEGTSVDEGREILDASGLKFRSASTLREAAAFVAEAVKRATA